MARYRYLQSFTFYGPFTWPTCEECQRFTEPIQETKLGDIVCLWCGVIFKNYSVKTDRHSKVCPRGPNLNHSNSFSWYEKRCRCVEEKELHDLLKDFTIYEAKEEEDEEDDWTSIGLPPPKPMEKCWCGYFH